MEFYSEEAFLFKRCPCWLLCRICNTEHLNGLNVTKTAGAFCSVKRNLPGRMAAQCCFYSHVWHQWNNYSSFRDTRLLEHTKFSALHQLFFMFTKESWKYCGNNALFEQLRALKNYYGNHFIVKKKCSYALGAQ